MTKHPFNKSENPHLAPLKLKNNATLSDIDEALLLASFPAHELAALSSEELSYLAAIDDTEDLPPGEDEESFSPDEWKELFIRFLECYEEAKTELAAKPRD